MAKEKKDIISRRSVIKASIGLGALGLSSKTLLAKEANKKIYLLMFQNGLKL